MFWSVNQTKCDGKKTKNWDKLKDKIIKDIWTLFETKIKRRKKKETYH